MQSKLRIIYIYDALCGWCYGFSKNIRQFYENHNKDFEFEVLSGGMMTGSRMGTVNEIAPFIKTAYKTVEETTGQKFGEPYIKHVLAGDMILDSEKPAIALSVFKSFLPEKSVPFVGDIQNSIFFEGKDANGTDLYRYLAVNFGIDPDVFESRMNLGEYKQAAYYEFAEVRQLGIQGYPAVLIQSSETQFHMIAKGYTDLDTLELRAENVVKELNGQF